MIGIQKSFAKDIHINTDINMSPVGHIGKSFGFKLKLNF